MANIYKKSIIDTVQFSLIDEFKKIVKSHIAYELGYIIYCADCDVYSGVIDVLLEGDGK